jgi:hypothetical protein
MCCLGVFFDFQGTPGCATTPRDATASHGERADANHARAKDTHNIIIEFEHGVFFVSFACPFLHLKLHARTHTGWLISPNATKENVVEYSCQQTRMCTKHAKCNTSSHADAQDD